jgi:hypothetical protein
MCNGPDAAVIIHRCLRIWYTSINECAIQRIMVLVSGRRHHDQGQTKMMKQMVEVHKVEGESNNRPCALHSSGRAGSMQEDSDCMEHFSGAPWQLRGSGCNRRWATLLGHAPAHAAWAAKSGGAHRLPRHRDVRMHTGARCASCDAH